MKHFLDRVINPDLGGIYHRSAATAVDSVSTSLPTAGGEVSSISADGITLQDQQIVLYTNLSDPSANNRLYRVQLDSQSMKYNLVLIADGRNPDGSAAPGDLFQILGGNSFAETHFGFDEGVMAQVDFGTLMPLIGNRIIPLVSAAGAGGAASAAMSVPGLLASDSIVSVSQKVAGANSLPLLGWTTQANDSLTVQWSADPGAGAIILVSVKR